MENIKETFKVKKSCYVRNKIITQNSIIAKLVIPAYDKKGNLSKNKIEYHIQGFDDLLNETDFVHLNDNLYLESIDIPIDYLKNYVILSDDYKNRKSLKNKFSKLYPHYSNIMTTFSNWIFSTKGSSAVTIQFEKNFTKNRNKILKETIFNGGMKSKPGSPYKNRSTRQTNPSDESGWESDSSTLLPNGIRKSDFCSFDETVKIFDKLIRQILSMDDVPADFTEFWNSHGYFKNDSPHVDYFYKNRISFKKFEQNTHHAKVKGLEFCHINPEIEYTTNSKNVTIGLCESNRHQGGYSIDHTFRKILIKNLMDEEFISDISETYDLSDSDLEEFYFIKKYGK
jgi:hypothetical protein